MQVFPKPYLTKMFVNAGYAKPEALERAQRIVDLQKQEEDLRLTREVLLRGLMEDLQKQILFPKAG